MQMTAFNRSRAPATSSKRCAPLTRDEFCKRLLEIIVVLLLFVLNGFFAMAELAIVSSRRAHLERLAKEGRPGAQVAIALADDPARMLAAIQIGFTTSAMLAGIYSGATLADRLEAALLLVPVLADYSKPLSIAVVTAGVTYTALIVGELAPKYIALNNPKSIAIRRDGPRSRSARTAPTSSMPSYPSPM